MVCQCGGTGKGIKSKVGRELDISLQALFTYLCDLCAFDCAISALILLFFNSHEWIQSTNPLYGHKAIIFCSTLCKQDVQSLIQAL
jgi:hypothetical protein